MIKDDLVQSSSEWHSWRGKGIGSSEIASIMNLNPYKKAREVWEEKTGLRQPEDLSNNINVKRGTTLEPRVRDMFNELQKAEFIPATFEHEELPYLRYSSDGIDFNINEIIEIKCPRAKGHKATIERKAPPDHYYPQCQWGLMISKADALWFVSYCPEELDNLYYCKVLPDQEFQEKMLIYAAEFWKRVETKSWPDNELDLILDA